MKNNGAKIDDDIIEVNYVKHTYPNQSGLLSVKEFLNVNKIKY